VTRTTTLAIAVAVLSSLAFAGAATVQGYAVGALVGENARKQRLSLSTLRVLVRNPRWLLGLLLAGAGSLLNAGALLMAPVSVVQPVGVLAVPWAVVLQATLRRRPVPRLELFAAAAALAGVAVFTALTALHEPTAAALDPVRIVVGAAVIYVAAEALGRLGSHGRPAWRSFFWAMAGAFFYGLESALVRTMRDYAMQADWLHSPLFWAMGIAVVAGALRAAWMIQQAYATGLPETVVGALTVTNPVVAVLFGLIVLGEGAHLAVTDIGWMTAAAAVAVLGVLLLSQAGSSPTPRSRSTGSAPHGR
jgi:drug/metabolite transporter (DMT)-like permease